jgi:hypothetical protein
MQPRLDFIPQARKILTFWRREEKHEEFPTDGERQIAGTQGHRTKTQAHKEGLKLRLKWKH